MNIIAFGDIHNDIDSIKKINGLSNADLIIITGDFTRYGGKKDAEKILGVIKKYNNNILALAGNMDKTEIDEYLTGLNINLNGSGFSFNDVIGIFGAGGSNPSPFHTPIEYSEEKLKSLVIQAHEKIANLPVKILISHAPPFNTTTDMLANGKHVGSTAIRDFIENFKPDLCICGHIHESRNIDKIGKTLIINPGIVSSGYVLINIIDKQVEAYLKNV